MPRSTDAAEVPRRLFSPIAPGYDRAAEVLSLFQYRRWHRFLLSRLDLPPETNPARPAPHSARPEPALSPVAGPVEGRAAHERPSHPHFRVLDMATGTGAVAADLLHRPGIEVVAADITRPMLLQAQARPWPNGARPDLIECTAEVLPFADAAFEAVVFAYLLRYVADVPATLRGLARLLRPGGTMASLDFAVPRDAVYPLWRLYTDAVLPLAGALFSAHWRRAGAFLGPSIRDFHRRWPQERLLDAWRQAGFPDVQARRLSLGGALVVWGTKAP